jgi:ribosomal protein S12 methylthiotransferase
MPTIALHNLGCSKNTIDGERILHRFRSAGYTVIGAFAEADIIVVNTCAFIREAKEEAIEVILESAAWKKKGRCRELLVTGCFSERYKKEARALIPEVDAWVGVHEWEEVLATRLGGEAPPTFERELLQPIATQHVKIAEGCSHACAFCVIPHIRGPYRSRPQAEIIGEARWLEERGVRELILVAQDTSFYGKDRAGNGTLADLIEALLKSSGFPWIRLMYLHPDHVDNRLIELFASEARLCPYFDMPVQHAADNVLSAMGRLPLSAGIRERIAAIRAAVPAAAIRSSLIIGFPGERAKEFDELERFVEETRFDRLGVFPFSPEEGTRAYSLTGRPRSTTVMRRCEAIMAIQRDISREKLAGRVGSDLEVLIEGASPDRAFPFRGRTRFDAPEVDGAVFVAPGVCSPGSFRKIRIVNASDHDLFGEIA